MMPLAMANNGEEQLIKKVGGKEETRLFLEKLGFVPGSKVSVVSEADGNHANKRSQALLTPNF